MVSAVLRWLAVPVVVAALVVLSGLSLNRVYSGSLLAQLVAGAAVGSVLISVVLRRAPAWLVAVLSVTAMVGYSILAVDISAQSGGVAGDLRTLAVDAARNAVPRLLTALIPVEPQPDTVLGPVILAWLTGFAGAELAARARRVGVALLPPALAYAGALVLVGPNAGVVSWHPLAFVALAALALVADGNGTGRWTVRGIARRQRATLRLRTAVGVGAALMAVLAVVAVMAPMVSATVGRTPVDPRGYVRPPTLDVVDQNPLIRIAGWAANPEQHLFDVEVMSSGREAPSTPGPTASAPTALDPTTSDPATSDPAASTPAAENEESAGAYDTRLRLAVLSDWDGVTWHMNADYRNAGRVLPPVAAPPGRPLEGAANVPPLTISERITVAELEGRLMPAIAAPRRVDGVRVAYDPSSGTLLHATALTAGVQYTVTSVNPSIEVNLLAAMDVPSGPDVARYLAVGDTVPPDLGRLAEQISVGESSPYLRALALESFIAEHYRYAIDAPSGHAYPNLRFFLFHDPRAGGQRGTSEQFAAAFAALGRLMGLPTRVVVGFHTPAGGGAVTGADALAWPEVLFDEVGWVPFNPLPEANTTPRPLEDEFLPKPPPPTSPPASLEPSPAPTWSAPPPVESAAAPPRSGAAPVVLVSAAGGGLLVLIVLSLLAVALVRGWRRRQRLDHGSPAQRVLGAWDEVLDALTLAGSPPPNHLAVGEVSSYAAAVVNASPSRRHAHRPRPAAPDLGVLAAKVNLVGFAGDVVGLGGFDELAAETAKIHAVQYTRALRARRSWWRRVWWRVDPRSLRRR